MSLCFLEPTRELIDIFHFQSFLSDCIFMEHMSGDGGILLLIVLISEGIEGIVAGSILVHEYILFKS